MLSVIFCCVTVMKPLWPTTKNICEGFSWPRLGLVHWFCWYCRKHSPDCKVTLGVVLHMVWLTCLSRQDPALHVSHPLLRANNLTWACPRDNGKSARRKVGTHLWHFLIHAVIQSKLHRMAMCTLPLQEGLGILWTRGMNRERMNNWRHTGN